jgi:hypothetical protein
MGSGPFAETMSVLLLRSQLDLHTRCENQVTNEIDRSLVRAGDIIASEEYKRKYSSGKHRPIAPSRKYNCHGLTFASRRTWIWAPAEITKILKDDDYTLVNLEDVLPGDVVVYFTSGDAEHSGIVIHNDVVPIILSKWGAAHEVIHRVNECPYDSTQISYYRIKT